jgi:hypothetical protein
MEYHTNNPREIEMGLSKVEAKAKIEERTANKTLPFLFGTRPLKKQSKASKS